MAKDYSKAAAAWAAGVQGAGQKWLNGINSTDVNPAAAAVAQQQKLIANWNASVTSGRWANALNRITTQSWQAATTTAGSGKYVAGVTKGTPKMAKYFAAAGPIYQQAHAIHSSTGDAMTKMQQNLQLMQSLKGVGK